MSADGREGAAGALPRRAFEWVERADASGFDAVVGSRSGALDLVFLPVAYAGAGGLPWVALVLLLRRRARRGSRLPVAAGTAGVAVAWAAAHGLKRATDRERPCHGCDGVALVDCPDGSSLPSDQAAAAFAGAAVVAAALPELAPRVYVAAAATAFARVYAGVHWPSDVVAGALLGHVVGRLAAHVR